MQRPVRSRFNRRQTRVIVTFQLLVCFLTNYVLGPDSMRRKIFSIHGVKIEISKAYEDEKAIPSDCNDLLAYVTLWAWRTFTCR
jgi:hypothetical protein